MSKSASQASFFPVLDLWWSESELHAWRRSRLQDPGRLFSKVAALPGVESACGRQRRSRSSSARLHGRTTNMPLQKPWKEEEVPRWNNVERIGQGRCRCLVHVVLFARLDVPVFAGTLPSRRRPGPRPPNRDVWALPCVNLALRSRKKVEVSIKHRVYEVRVLCLSFSLSSPFFSFQFYIF